MTYTFAILEVSKAVFDEIRGKLEAAGYSDQFHIDAGRPVVDMHGIALKAEVVPNETSKASPRKRRVQKAKSSQMG
jgi:hypothetical protein